MRDDIDIPLPAMSPGGTASTSYRVPRARESIDPNTKRLAIIAAAIAGVIVVFAGAASYMGAKRSGVPVIEADSKPIRTKPTDAGGMQVAGKDEAILSGKTEGQPALAPQTEAPAPAALKAALTQPAPAPAVAPNPAAASIASALPPVTPSAPAAIEKPAPAAVARTAPAEAKPQPKQATAAPIAAPAPAAAKPASSTLAMAQPPAAPAAATHVAATTAATSAKGPMIQLAAVGSEQAAQAEWARLAKKFPEVLGTRKPVFSKVERDGKTFWRIRTAGFADANAAKGACDKLRAQGAPGCTVSAS
ncbi:MAG: SPOR domain-containing protein [Alphaproteobacteria bacterium]|nr:SPOR domain-containing protein [Alphaproteobacteria bacterium]